MGHGALLLAACVVQAGDEWTWYERQSHPALVDGAWTHAQELRCLDSAFTEHLVGADWLSDFVHTEAELRPLLRPLVDGPSALACLELLQHPKLRGGHALAELPRSLPLEFDGRVPEGNTPCRAYRPSDAARWNVPREPRIRLTDRGVEVRRPVWRPLRPGEEEGRGRDGAAVFPWVGSRPGRIEYVVDAVSREGQVTRTVERVLEAGPAARAYGPIPLL